MLNQQHSVLTETGTVFAPLRGMTNMWTNEWPTEPGDYWCYFRRKRIGDKFRLRRAKVSRGANCLIITVEGEFLYKSEIGLAFWMPIDMPKLPEFDCPGPGKCHGEMYDCPTCGKVRPEELYDYLGNERACDTETCVYHPKRPL